MRLSSNSFLSGLGHVRVFNHQATCTYDGILSFRYCKIYLWNSPGFEVARCRGKDINYLFNPTYRFFPPLLTHASRLLSFPLHLYPHLISILASPQLDRSGYTRVSSSEANLANHGYLVC